MNDNPGSPSHHNNIYPTHTNRLYTYILNWHGLDIGMFRRPADYGKMIEGMIEVIVWLPSCTSRLSDGVWKSANLQW
jgi:hypothetical protein